jgi:hypothetical protein
MGCNCLPIHSRRKAIRFKTTLYYPLEWWPCHCTREAPSTDLSYRLTHSISSDYTDEKKKELYSTLRYVLGSLVVLFSPLSVHSLSTLLHVTKQNDDETLEDLHAILDIPDDQNCALGLHHPSFRDFLLDKNRCGDLNLQVDETQAHRI